MIKEGNNDPQSLKDEPQRWRLLSRMTIRLTAVGNKSLSKWAICRMAFTGLTILLPLSIGITWYSEYAAQADYCSFLKHSVFEEYQVRHKQWPESLNDVQRDLESNARYSYHMSKYEANQLTSTFCKYKPSMTVLQKNTQYIKVRIRFEKGYLYRGVIIISV